MSKQPTNERQSADHWGWPAVVVLCGLFGGWLVWVQIAKWQSFHPANFDYANVASIFEDLLHSRLRPLDPAQLYGPLLSQFYLLYFLLYALLRSVYTLMAIHAFFFSVALFLTYLAARTIWRRPWWPLLFTAALALNPLFNICALSGFRQSAPVLPAVLGLFIAWRKGNKRWFAVCAVIAAAAQANVALALAPLGMVLWRRAGEKFFGRTLVATAGGFLVLNIALLMLARHFSSIKPPDNMLHLIAFGQSPGEALRRMFTQPGLVLASFFYWKNVSLLLLAITFLGLPFLAPRWLAGALFELIYMALSTRGLTELAPRTAWAVNLDHPVLSFFNTGMITALPFFIVAALLGAEKLGLWARKNATLFTRAFFKRLAFLIFLAATAVMHYTLTPNAYGPVPGARGADWAAVRVDAHDRLLRHRLETLAVEYTYLMQFDFYFQAYHVPQRTLLTPEKAARITFDYVLLDTQGECPIIGRESCEKLWRELPADPSYRIAWEKDGIILLCRTTLL